MDTFFFIVSKILWFVVSPDHLLVLLLVLTSVLFYVGYYRWGKRLLAANCTIVVCLTFFPVGEWLLYPLESRFSLPTSLDQDITGFVVLSGSEMIETSEAWQQVELNHGGERNLVFMQMIRRFPEARHVFTGGNGSLQALNSGGAEIAEQLYREQGIDVSRIEFEREARNTYENAKYTQALVKPTANEKWVLITTSWHMPRSVGIFRQLGWDVIPYPVDHYTLKGQLWRIDVSFAHNLLMLKTALKEWLGLVAYYLSGKTSALFPAAVYHAEPKAVYPAGHVDFMFGSQAVSVATM